MDYYRLENKVQKYAWGSRGNKSLVRNLAGISEEEDVPYAELWMGTHPSGPSLYPDGEKGAVSLKEIIDREPEFMLGRALAEGQRNLPFLGKVLSVSDILSIQLHPSSYLASSLHEQDPGHYPDKGAKAEVAVALGEFHALAGFSPVAVIRDMLSLYRSLKPLRSIIKKFDRPQDDSGFYKNLTASVIELKNDDNTFKNVLADLKTEFSEKTAPSLQEKLFLKYSERYSCDPGLLFILFLKYHILNRGESLYLRTGVPHAYISGDILECMVSSDNVIRFGLTPKFADHENMTTALNDDGKSPFLHPRPIPGGYSYCPDEREFSIDLFEIDEKSLDIYTGGNPAILLILEGGGELLRGNAVFCDLKIGDSFFIPAGAGGTVIRSPEHCRCVIFRSDY